VKAGSAFLTYLTLSLVLTWPVARGLGSDVPGDLGDSLLNMWILAWGAEHVPKLVTGAIGWNEFWNANIFHPAPLALAFSEHLFGQTLQILPVYWLTGNIILCYNLLFISSFALSGFGAYLLVRDLTGNNRAAFIAGLAYGFLPYRIASVPHIQVMSSQWMPYALWGLNRFITRIPDAGSPRPAYRGLASGTGALVLQNWSCGYYLLYFAPFVPLFVIHRMWTQGVLRNGRAWALLGAAAITTVALSLPFLFPYREAQQVHGFERPIGEVYFFAANFWSYITASENVRLYGDLLRFNVRSEQELFLGFVPLALAIVALAAGVWRAAAFSSAVARSAKVEAVAASTPSLSIITQVVTILLAVAAATQFFALISVILFGGFELDVAGIPIRARTPVRTLLQFLVAFGLLLAVSPRARVGSLRAARSPIALFALLAVLAVWLSFGPRYGLYELLYDYVPGFNGLRVPARYAMIAGLFLAVLSGFGTRTLLDPPKPGALSSGRRRTAVLAALILLEGTAVPIEHNRTWAQNEAMPPARVYPRAEAPVIYGRLAALPAGTVVTEFPFGDVAWEIRYTYYAAAHWKPITNGYSGSFPQSYKERVARLQRVTVNPDAAWQALRDAGTTHVVIHRNAFAASVDADAVELWLKSNGATELERFADGDILLKL
jgi:hypothetical protein